MKVRVQLLSIQLILSTYNIALNRCWLYLFARKWEISWR